MLRSKKILVTGADGFIGSHLVEMLVREGANVRALSQYNSFNYWGWLEDMDCLKEVEVITGDIRDSRCCDRMTKGADIVFHLASLIAIPYSYAAPESYVDTNVRGALNICQAALKNRCKRVMHTSTSEVYGTARYVPIDEAHPLQPQSPYSASKIASDAMAMSFHNSFGLPLTIARPFNTYGPRQSARAVIPAIITQIASGRKEIKLGDVRPTRDFTYVEDMCMALIALAGCEKAIGETVNIGSNFEVSIREVFDIIKGLMSSPARCREDCERLRPKTSEVFRLRCDNARIRKLVGFRPKYTLKDGLARTIEWFSESRNLSKYKEGIYNV